MFAQQWTTRRTVSQNDMIAEAGGALLGLLLWFAIGRRIVGYVRGLHADRESPTAASPTRRLLQLYALGFVLYSLQPFDFTFSHEEISRQFRDHVILNAGGTIEGKIVGQDRQVVRIRTTDEQTIRTVHRSSIRNIQPRKVIFRPFAHSYKNPFDAAWQLGSDVLLFVPFGMLLRYRRDEKRSVAKTVIACLGIAATIELAQLFVFSRFLDTTDVISSGAGAWIGALIAGAYSIGKPIRSETETQASGTRVLAAIGLCLLYTAPLAVIMWHPYKPVGNVQVFLKQFSQFFDLPFKAHYYAGEFKALSNLMRSLMLFLPVGALIRWGFGHVRDGFAAKRLVVIVVAGFMGLLLEAGKAAMQAKHADITDWMLYVFGALFGWWLWGMMTGNTRQLATTSS